MSIVMGLDQHRAQITAEWLDTETGEVSRARVTPADRDWAVKAWGDDLARAIGVEGRLRRTFALPSDDTLRNLLAAAAAGTATVLGLVLSISLIVWQTTAERYRSSNIVGFLLRERVASAVVNLLALAFAYALWVLALLEILGAQRPYVSAALALLLSTFAVLSLLSYRQAGLVGYLPVSIAGSLAGEIARQRERVQRRGAGRSVEDCGRRVTRGDLQIFRDLLTRLVSEQDVADVASTVGTLQRVLIGHLHSKPYLRRESLFFERRAERLTGWGGTNFQEHLGSEGLMPATNPVPDHQWVEREVLDLVRLTTREGLIDRPEVFEAVVELYQHAMQYAWLIEDATVVELVLNDAEDLME